jgi:hypothetical protein
VSGAGFVLGGRRRSRALSYSPVASCAGRRRVRSHGRRRASSTTERSRGSPAVMRRSPSRRPMPTARAAAHRSMREASGRWSWVGCYSRAASLRLAACQASLKIAGHPVRPPASAAHHGERRRHAFPVGPRQLGRTEPHATITISRSDPPTAAAMCASVPRQTGYPARRRSAGSVAM